MPFGLTTVVPLVVPTWKPEAGGVRPTMSVSGLSVGGAAVRLAPAVVAAIRLTASTLAVSARTIFFTWYPRVVDGQNLTRGEGSGEGMPSTVGRRRASAG